VGRGDEGFHKWFMSDSHLARFHWRKCDLWGRTLQDAKKFAINLLRSIN